MTVSNTSNPYVLDTFDEDFPDQYNTLHEQARLGRAHKECSLARIGRKLKTAPEYGDSLRDPTRLMRRTSRVEARGGAGMQPGIDKLRQDITRARARTTMCRNQRFNNTPQHRRQSVQAHARAKSKIFGAQKQRMDELKRFAADHASKDLAYRIAFEKFDVDGSGYIDADELYLALAHMGLGVDQDGSDALLHKYDVDDNGKLDFGEFKAMCVDLLFSSETDGLFIDKAAMMRQLENASRDAKTSLEGLDLTFDTINRSKVAVKPGDAIDGAGNGRFDFTSTRVFAKPHDREESMARFGVAPRDARSSQNERNRLENDRETRLYKVGRRLARFPPRRSNARSGARSGTGGPCSRPWTWTARTSSSSGTPSRSAAPPSPSRPGSSATSRRPRRAAPRPPGRDTGAST